MGLILVTSTSVLHLHMIYMVILLLTTFVVYIVLPIAHLSALGLDYSALFRVTAADFAYIGIAGVLALLLSFESARRTRVEFYDKTLLAQEFTMLKSELGVKKKKVQTEDFINSPIQSIVHNLKSLLDNLPADQQELLNNTIETLLTSKDLYRTQLNDESVSVGVVDNEVKRYLQATANVITKKAEEPVVSPSHKKSYYLDSKYVEDAVMTSGNGALIIQQIISNSPVLDLLHPSWEFDILEYNEAVHNQVIVTLTVNAIDQNHLDKRFNIPPTELHNFATKVQEGYVASNPYHNGIHGASVLYDMNWFMCQEGIRSRLSNLDFLGGLLAAVVHDLGHDGFANAYHVKALTPLAITYNDRTCLENYHIAAAFTIMVRDDSNVLKNLERSEFLSIRNSMIELVLATDLKCHFDHLSKMKLKNTAWETKKETLEESARDDTWDPADGNIFTLQTFLKMADLAHCVKSFAIHTKWCDRISEELFCQGDAERKNGFEISPFCDRTNYTISKSQTGFIKFMVSPLFTNSVGIFHHAPSYNALIKYLSDNAEIWVAFEAAGRVYMIGDSTQYDEDNEVVLNKLKEQAASKGNAS
jgi:hypothetical protein